LTQIQQQYKDGHIIIQGILLDSVVLFHKNLSPKISRVLEGPKSIHKRTAK